MNIKDFTLRLTYLLDGKRKALSLEYDLLKDGFEEDGVSVEEIGSEEQVKLVLNAKTAVQLVEAEVIFDHYFENSEAFFANGYQSWTLSREYRRGDVQSGLYPLCRLPLFKKYAAPSGDYNFAQYGKELYHSFSYTYLRNDDRVELIGSLDERTAYTVFYADMRENVFVASRDIEGLAVLGEVTLFDFVRIAGSYDEAFDRYFELYPQKATGRVNHLAGYTSWYNYYQSIDEKTILRDLDGLRRADDAATIFQIDDGFEVQVGDWDVDAQKFPSGLLPIVEKIHAQGLMAGLWLAPFAAQKNSRIVREHPDWLVRNEKGKPVVAGINWGGFYALDIEIEDVRRHIKALFDKVLYDWGFDMVKLDFLYAAAIYPRANKTRGRLMSEAMDFLRECCGDKIMLGCGVPLAPAFGRADACRIGCDAELRFKDKLLAKITNREMVSTKNALTNTVFRRHLNGRIWANDPDVFFLREGGFKPVGYTDEQKRLLAKINHMFGSVLFVSDDVGEYSEQQLALLLEAYKPYEGSVRQAGFEDDDTIKIVYEEAGERHTLTFNILTGKTEEV